MTSLTAAIWLALALFSALSAADESALPPAAQNHPSDDWLQLTSGEWLRGRGKGMYDEVLISDSKRFEFMNIDQENIALLNAQQPMMVNIDNVGIIQIRGDRLRLRHDDVWRTFSLKNIIAFSPAREKTSDSGTSRPD